MGFHNKQHEIMNYYSNRISKIKRQSHRRFNTLGRAVHISIHFLKEDRCESTCQQQI